METLYGGYPSSSAVTLRHICKIHWYFATAKCSKAQVVNTVLGIQRINMKQIQQCTCVDLSSSLILLASGAHSTNVFSP